MGQTRLKSSFIYLANAVNDLRANWAALALVLAPLVAIAAICVLPDALNLEHLVAEHFAPGVRNVAMLPVQASAGPLAEIQPLFPRWTLLLFHSLLAILTITVQLFVMCTIRRVQTGVQHPEALNEAIAIYREAIQLVPAYLWIRLLQIGAIVIGSVLFIVPGVLLFVWLYFAEFALVFDGHRSFAALLWSRNLLRKRFLRVAIRIVVFMAVWSGYNSWVAGVFFASSFLIGPLGTYTGSLWTAVLLLSSLATAVGFATTAFFVVAGTRLYHDLISLREDEEGTAVATAAVVLPPTVPLPAASL